MNKEILEITNKDIELLKEMKKNCLKSNVYEDDKRLLKSNAITKFLMLYEENQELKKQLEEYKRLGFKHLNDKCNKLENQQKEFINWLIENESLDDYCNETTFTYVRDKYEEIIGVLDEKK